LHLHELLSSESVVAHSSALLAAVWHVDVPAVQLRCRLRSDYRIAVVPSAEGLLLCNSWSWLRDYSSAGASGDSTTHSVPNATAHASPDSTRHTLGASGSIQLRCGRREHMGTGQERLVLPQSPPWLSSDSAPAAAHAAAHPASSAADFAAKASGSLQLQ